MRILPLMPLAEGYEPPMPELNQEEGVLEIAYPTEASLIEESALVAETLILRCALRPIPFLHPVAQVQLIEEGDALDPAPLYDEKTITYGYEGDPEASFWQAVALDYTGVGWRVNQGEMTAFYDNTLGTEKLNIAKPLYIKPFKVETAAYQERMTSLPSGSVLRSPPGVLDTQIWRGYGGYYKPGLPLEEIQQIYYSLTSTHQRTRVRLVSSEHLAGMGTPPPEGGKMFDYAVQFSPLKEEEYLSLPGAIAAGYAQLSVQADWGENAFSSFSCKAVPGSPGIVNVHFRGV